MKKTTLSLTIIFFLIPLSFSFSSDPNHSKKEAIFNLLDESGIILLGESRLLAVGDSIEQGLRKKSNLPSETYHIINDEIQQLINEEIIINKSLHNYLYHEYDRKFTTEQINKLLSFFRTEDGKMVKSLISIMCVDSYHATNVWMERTLISFPQRLNERLKEKNIDINDYIHSQNY